MQGMIVCVALALKMPLTEKITTNLYGYYTLTGFSSHLKSEKKLFTGHPVRFIIWRFYSNSKISGGSPVREKNSPESYWLLLAHVLNTF